MRKLERIALIGHTRSGNAVGRLYSNWLALRAVGVEPRVLLPPGSRYWSPVASDVAFTASVSDSPDLIGSWSDSIVIHKPWPGSLDVGLDMSRQYNLPTLLDVDDPDFENSFSERRWIAMLQATSRPHRWRASREILRLRASVNRVYGVSISNPSLRKWYNPAVVIPHARPERTQGRAHQDEDLLRIAFVGTPRAHKGIQALRDAAAVCRDTHLTITAPEPSDLRPRERWTGQVSLNEGLAIVDESDIVCIPSENSVMGRGQLPAKLIDAMMSGRAIVATDLPPIRWAVGDGAILVNKATPEALAAAFQELRDHRVRSGLGAVARQRAIANFSAPNVGRRLLNYLELLNDVW